MGEFFARFPELNVRQIAQAMGVNETLMQQYVNGKKCPSFERVLEIESFIHQLGKELSQTHIIPKE